MGEAAKLFTRSLMMGLDSAVRKNEFAELTAEDVENLPYAEAVEYLKKRDVIKKVDYNKLSDKMRFRAFTASRIADGDLLKRINSELIKNVNDGKGLKDFLSLTKTDILDKVGMGAGGQGWYWETVYRTNVQTAYNTGRMMGFEEDKPLALHFVGIEDARQTDVCHSLSNVIRPYDDPLWEKYIPPLHFGCRSTVRAIYDEDELPEEWSSLEGIEKPAKGFGTNPLENDSWWNELSSQVARAKEYGVQGEIEAAKEMLFSGGKHGKGDGKKVAEDEIRNIKAEPVIDEIAGITKGNPMTFDEADSGNVNPGFQSDIARQGNCQSCVPTFIARLLGFNIQAKPYDKDNPIMNALMYKTNLAFIDRNTKTFPEMLTPKKTGAELTTWLLNHMEDNKYYSVGFDYKPNLFLPGGHVLVMHKNKGILTLYDPQDYTKTTQLKQISTLLRSASPNSVEVYNISDCDLNKNVLDFIVEAKE